MADDEDSDLEFARFLEEDDSASISASFQLDTRAAAASMRTSKKNKKSGSASAVTAAAAALLASSKLLSGSGKKQATGSSSSKKKSSKGKSSNSTPKAKKSAMHRDDDVDDDDEEPPPSYSASRRSSLDADPYAFALDTSFHLQSDDDDDDDDASDSDAAQRKRKSTDRNSKKKKKSAKSKSGKRETKPVLSLEDRVALILKRTGSANAPTVATDEPADRKRGDDAASGDDSDGSDARESHGPLLNALDDRAAAAKRDASDASDHSSDEDDDDDAKQLSMSDSLGINSADFEVGAHAKRQLERSRLSLASSLNSDKFAVNTDALEGNGLHAANPRYATPSATLAASRYDTSDGEPDDYDDDGFELDQTTGGDGGGSDLDGAPLSTADAESYESNESRSDGSSERVDTADAPVMSPFETMEDRFGVDASLDRVGASAAAATSAAADAFGYEDEDFETDEADEQTDEQQTPEPLDETPAASALEAATGEAIDTQVDAHRAVAVATPVTELPAWYLRPLPADANAVTSLESPSASDALLAAPSEIEVATPIADAAIDRRDSNAHQEQADSSTRDREGDAGAGFGRDPRLESPPMSPPPPPPPEDDDELDERDPNGLHAFSLSERATSQRYDSSDREAVAAQPHARHDHVASTLAAGVTITRFEHLQSHVAALRIVTGQPPLSSQQTPKRDATGRRNDTAAARCERKRDSHAAAAAPPVWTRPLPSPLPPVDLVRESNEMDAFLRRSRRLEREREQLRGSGTRETELTLRLQHAQRQILQLKRHIQGSNNDSDDSGISGDKFGDGADDTDGRTVDEATASDAVVVVDVSVSDDRPIPNAAPAAVRTSQSHQPRRRDSPSPSRHVTSAEFAALQKEMQTQETLIQAFQRENEQLMRQLKRLQRSAQGDVLNENEQLKRQVRELRDALETQRDNTAAAADGSSACTATAAQYRLAVEARLQAEARALAADDELAAARSAHQMRENELTLALARVKQAKRELECRYEGVDVAQLARESEHVQTLERDLASTRFESQRALASLQRKLDWYVANQRLLDAQDDERAQLKRDVARLTAELQTANTVGTAGAGTGTAASKSPAKSPAKSPLGLQRSHYTRSPADIRRINELESRVREMELAMRKRHPDSLVNLILATQRADDDAARKAMADAFDTQLRDAEREREELQAAHETKLESFRQQQEKLVLLFQRRIRDLEKQLATLQARGGSSGSSKRRLPPATRDRLATATGNDDDVQRVRAFYADKIQALERTWSAKLRALKRQSGASASASTRPSTGATTTIANRERQLRDKDAVAVAEPLDAADPVAVAADSSSSTKPLDAAAASDSALLARLQSVETQLAASEDARAHLVQSLSLLQTVAQARQSQSLVVRDDPSTAAAAAATAEQLETVRQQAIAETQQQLRTAFDAERDALRAAHSTELARATASAAALEAQTRTLEAQINSFALEREQLRLQLEAAQAAKPALEHEVAQLRLQLAVPRTPSMVQYRSLEMKIETLSQKHVLREAELKVLLARATQSSELEKRELERVHQSAIAAKNVEIRHFKKQLDVILYELELLRQPQAL